jgi:hypothetical protein
MQRYLDAAMSGDWDTGFGFFADDIALHIPVRSEFSGEHRGKQVAIDYIRTARARSEGAEVELELIDMLASEERVALLVRERFHREDGVVEIRRANVYRVQREKIVEIWIFEADQYAVDELLG